MARRSNRRKNFDTLQPQAAPPISRATRSVSAPARSTMRVSLASRVLAETLPDIIYSKPERRATPARVAAPVRSVRPAVKQNPPLARRETSTPNTVKPDVKRAAPEPVAARSTLREPRKCKVQPKSNSGNGTSRPFVPWKDGACK